MHDCEFGRLVFSNHSAKADSATHGTKNIIANRLAAVSERILIGKSGVYTENNNESRIEGSNPSVPMVPS